MAYVHNPNHMDNRAVLMLKSKKQIASVDAACLLRGNAPTVDMRMSLIKLDTNYNPSVSPVT